MTGMLEKMARAIAKRAWSLTDAELAESWSKTDEREHLLRSGRAALQAIREPDEGMLDAAYVTRKRKIKPDENDDGRLFTAMIDHVLNEEEEGGASTSPSVPASGVFGQPILGKLLDHCGSSDAQTLCGVVDRMKDAAIQR